MMSRSSSPTAPIDEKRIARRAPTRIPATVSVGKRRVAFKIDDISTSGARLTGQLPLVVGQRIRIALSADTLPAEPIVAEVVRVHTADLVTDQVAVRFLVISPAVRAAIARLVADDGDEERVTDQVPKLVPEELDAATLRFEKKRRP